MLRLSPLDHDFRFERLVVLTSFAAQDSGAGLAILKRPSARLYSKSHCGGLFGGCGIQFRQVRNCEGEKVDIRFYYPGNRFRCVSVSATGCGACGFAISSTVVPRGFWQTELP